MSSEQDLINAMLKQYLATNNFNQTYQEFRRELRANSILTKIENVTQLTNLLNLDSQVTIAVQDLLYQFAEKQLQIAKKQQELEMLMKNLNQE